MIPGNPNPKNAPPAGAAPKSPAMPPAPAAPVDEEAHFRLDDHQRQIDELKRGDMKALVHALMELVGVIRELIATRKV
jgi:hypothetical protein